MKIDFNDTVIDSFLKMADGNPGAITVMLQLMDETPHIDPDNILGGFGNILDFDTMGIYGSDIWILYKDVCGESIENVVALLRGRQLGLLNENTIDAHIHAHSFGGKPYTEYDSLVKSIREIIPNFNYVGGK